MFRTSDIRDIQLQKIISKEIMNAFEDTFCISSGDAEQISSCIEEFCENMCIPMNSKLEHDLLIYKIIGMYSELKDPNYQYTFDEQGEWLLSKLLLYHLSLFESFLECAEDNDNKGFEDHEPSVEDFWDSALTDDDKKYVSEYADRFFDSLIEDIEADEDDIEDITLEYQEMKQLFIDRVTYFPIMAFEITDDVMPEFLFWDRDFLMVEKYGPSNFAAIKEKLQNEGLNMGFMSVNENTMLFTGSERFDLNEV